MKIKFKHAPRGSTVTFRFVNSFVTGIKLHTYVVIYDAPIKGGVVGRSTTSYSVSGEDEVSVQTCTKQLQELQFGDIFYYNSGKEWEPYTLTNHGTGESVLNGDILHCTPDADVRVVIYRYKLVKFASVPLNMELRADGGSGVKIANSTFTLAKKGGGGCHVAELPPDKLVAVKY